MILSTSVKKIYLHTLLIYFGSFLFCIIFNYVYSMFSHNVNSFYMSLAFLYPLILGVVVYGLLWLFPYFYVHLSYNFYNLGVATITIGSILKGVNEIAGADSWYYKCFFGFAFAFFVISLGLGLFPFIRRKRNNDIIS